MTTLANIRDFIKASTLVSRSNALAAGVIGAAAHFVFFFVFRYGFGLNESFPLRMIATALCLSMLFKSKIPDSLLPYFPFYWHTTIIIVLPLVFTYNLLINNFHELWLYWEIFMVFTLIMFSQHWVMSVFDLLIGVAGAILLFLVSNNGVQLQPSFNMPLWGIVMSFSLVAGYLFSFSNWQTMKAEERRKAKEKTMALEALAGGIAHEMRNPLGQIRHNLDEILQELPAIKTTENTESIASIRQRVAQAHTAVNRGLHVIDMTLENFRQDDLGHEDFTVLSAAAATRKAIDEYGYASEEERRCVNLQASDDFIFRGEENSYIFVLYNMLLNALHVLKNNPAGNILIRLVPGESVNKVIVRDNGSGISPENLSRIFDPFFTSGKKGGTGLGLAFCKRVMLSFGGDIQCTSTPGKSTEFILKFPALAKAEIQDYESKLYGEYRNLFSGKRLLLAGNNEEHLAIFRKLLEPLRVVIDETLDGASALSLIELKRYDLLLTDLDLPILGATELAQRLKDQGRDLPVVAYTSRKHAEIFRNLSESGIDACIHMPPALSELLHILKTSLETTRKALKESMSGKTVLVVDDLDINRRVIKSMLKKLDVTILEASNGQEALELLEGNNCDLLVMDMKMPVLDGFETTRRIRSGRGRHRDLPILGLSGNLDNKSFQMAKLSGMNDCLIKPVKIKLFLQKVSAMLKSENNAAA